MIDEHPLPLFDYIKQIRHAPPQEKWKWEFVCLFPFFLGSHMISCDAERQQHQAQSTSQCSSGWAEQASRKQRAVNSWVMEGFKRSPLSKSRPEEQDEALLRACRTVADISEYLYVWQQDYCLTANTASLFFFQPCVAVIYITAFSWWLWFKNNPPPKK